MGLAFDVYNDIRTQYLGLNSWVKPLTGTYIHENEKFTLYVRAINKAPQTDRIHGVPCVEFLNARAKVTGTQYARPVDAALWQTPQPFPDTLLMSGEYTTLKIEMIALKDINPLVDNDMEMVANIHMWAGLDVNKFFMMAHQITTSTDIRAN